MKYSWLANMLFLMVVAWLIAGMLNAVIAFHLRQIPVLHLPPAGRIHTEPEVSETTNPYPWQLVRLWTTKSKAWIEGVSIESLGKFEFPDNVSGSSRLVPPLDCAPYPQTDFFGREIRGLDRPEVLLFMCRPRRLSIHELNLLCVVTREKKVVSWTHLWEHDSEHQVLAQGGEPTADRTCLWLKDYHEPP